MRELQCEFAVLQKPDGSVMFQQGNSKVCCAVYGPAEVKEHKVVIDQASIECILKPKTNTAGVKEKALEEVIMKSCKQIILTKYHPRSAMQIVLQVMQNSGSLLSVLINSACMAMLHAGLPMKSMMMAVCCAIRSTGEFIIDPTDKDEEDARCVLTFVFESKNYEVVSSYTTGSFTIDEYFRCLQFAQLSAKDINAFQRISVERFLSRQSVQTEEVTEDEEEYDADDADEQNNIEDISDDEMVEG